MTIGRGIPSRPTGGACCGGRPPFKHHVEGAGCLAIVTGGIAAQEFDRTRRVRGATEGERGADGGVRLRVLLFAHFAGEVSVLHGPGAHGTPIGDGNGFDAEPLEFVLGLEGFFETG